MHGAGRVGEVWVRDGGLVETGEQIDGDGVVGVAQGGGCENLFLDAGLEGGAPEAVLVENGGFDLWAWRRFIRAAQIFICFLTLQ